MVVKNEHFTDPLSTETSPSDRLFPMPTAADPSPYINQANIEPKDFFGHRNVSSPLAPIYPKLETSSSQPQNLVISRKPVGSPPSRQNSTSSVVHTKKNSDLSKNLTRGAEIPLVPLFFENDFSGIEPDYSKKAIPLATPVPTMQPKPPSPTVQSHTFLDRTRILSEVGYAHKKEATANSYRSALTSQAVLGLPLPQSLKRLNQGKPIISLDDFPPISLKDPITARMPSDHPPSPLLLWAPPTITDTEPNGPISFTTTPITITTGCAPPLDRPIQLDGSLETTEHSPVHQQPLQHKPNPRLSRTGSQQSQRLNDTHSSMFHVHPADIVTFSEHQLTPTKHRTARLCQTTSPEREEAQSRSIPTSISMSPGTPEKANHGAYSAAVRAFQNSRHLAAMKGKGEQDGSHLTTPKTRKGLMEGSSDIERKFMVVPGGLGDIGRHSRNEDDIILYQKSLLIATKSRGASERQDDLVVWRLSPTAEKNAESKRKIQPPQNKGVSLVKACHPPAKTVKEHEHLREDVQVVSQTKKAQAPRPVQGTPHSQPQQPPPQPSIRRMLIRVVQTIWWFVEPVFEPNSAFRKRWERDQYRLTLKDMGMCLAAALFTITIFMIIAGLVRIIGIAFQILKAFLGLFYVFTSS